jgi:hypothetical protein
LLEPRQQQFGPEFRSCISATLLISTVQAKLFSHMIFLALLMYFSTAPPGGLHRDDAACAEKLFIWKNWNNAVFNVC